MVVVVNEQERQLLLAHMGIAEAQAKLPYIE
jgi:hypothetical protein